MHLFLDGTLTLQTWFLNWNMYASVLPLAAIKIDIRALAALRRLPPSVTLNSNSFEAHSPKSINRAMIASNDPYPCYIFVFRFLSRR